LNPFAGSFFLSKDAFSPVYWRLFWLLPIYPAIAYAASDILSGINNLWEYIFTTVVFCFVFSFPGKLMFSKEQFDLPQNVYRLPQSVISISNYIEKDAHGESVKIMIPEDISPYIRTYDANLRIVWSRSIYVKYDFDAQDAAVLNKFISNACSNNSSDVGYIVSNMKKFGLSYLVVPSGKPAIKNAGENGLKLETKINGYSIYAIN
jgi:hypothetical protein